MGRHSNYTSTVFYLTKIREHDQSSISFAHRKIGMTQFGMISKVHLLTRLARLAGAFSVGFDLCPSS
jgi:hypothetical protein